MRYSTARIARWLGRLASLLLILGIVPSVYPQGCAMCLVSALQQGSRAIESMNSGILLLLIPSFLMIVGMLAFTFLRRN